MQYHAVRCGKMRMSELGGGGNTLCDGNMPLRPFFSAIFRPWRGEWRAPA